jgi:preprotein translocase subunit SecD
MLRFPAWKIVSVMLICLWFVVLALPNVLSDKTLGALPEFIRGDRINLGLDLRGGSYLLLEVDKKSVLKDHIADLRTAVRAELRDKKIGYTVLTVKSDTVQLHIRPDTVPQDVVIGSLLRRIDSGINLETLSDSQYVLSYSDAAKQQKLVSVVAQTIEIIGRRIDETGTREPVIQQQGEGRILLQVPGLDNPQKLKDILGKTAKLTFHMVNHHVGEEQLYSKDMPIGTKIFMSEKEGDMPPRPYALFSEATLSGESLIDANASDDRGNPIVAFRFDTQGARKFADVTKSNIGKQFAVVLDDKVITAPVIRSAILEGRGVIEGSFTRESASDLALLLRAGALPTDVNIIEERSVGPSLGADSIRAGIAAAVIAIALVMIFMLMAYGLFGMFSNIALCFNMVILLGALSWLQATLTLPGLAGIVLTLGMAVDANVLIFERIKEEMASKKSIPTAIERGFNSAFGTILDSNLTTLIAAFALFYFGSGTVKGFAVTLSFGILSSMFSAIMLTRLMIVLWMQKTRPTTLSL